jgi:L-threonylcarbamoyladenylate synthase
VLLRPGGIAASALSRVLGQPLAEADANAPRASGTLAAHYAPRTPANLLATDMLRAEITQLDERDEIVAVLARTLARPADFTGVWLPAPADARQYAHDLYANLRTLDAANADVILIENVPDDDAWLAVRDRLSRAARGVDDDRD